MPWMTYCCLCGGSPELDYYIKLKNTSWLTKVGAILESGKYAFGNYDAEGMIEMGTYFIRLDPLSYVPDHKLIKRGFLVHKKCYELAKNVKDIHAKICSFKQDSSGFLSGLNYSPLKKYSSQDFDWEKFLKNEKDHYALEDPSKNPKNKKRIQDNIKKIDKKKIKTFKYAPITSRKRSISRRLKSRSRSPSKKKRIRSKSTRKSPPVSATSYSVGTKKKGNDGNMWVIKKTKIGDKRWVRS